MRKNKNESQYIRMEIFDISVAGALRCCFANGAAFSAIILNAEWNAIRQIELYNAASLRQSFYVSNRVTANEKVPPFLLRKHKKSFLLFSWGNNEKFLFYAEVLHEELLFHWGLRWGFTVVLETFFSSGCGKNLRHARHVESLKYLKQPLKA